MAEVTTQSGLDRVLHQPSPGVSNFPQAENGVVKVGVGEGEPSHGGPGLI